MDSEKFKLSWLGDRLKRSYCLVVLAGSLILASAALAAENPAGIKVTSKASLVHLGSLDSFDITEGGKKAARGIVSFLETGNTNSAAMALQTYKRIIPDENFGGEYTALEWFCEYVLAGPAQQKAMLADPFVDSFYQFFTATNYSSLKRYLNRKYHLLESEDKGLDKSEERFLEDFILFNNPRRENWEKTSKLMAALPIKEGDSVADIGSGPGYYTVKFAKRVGGQGRVYAVEVNPKHCRYLEGLTGKLGLQNVEVVQSREDDITLSKPVDLAFLCSLYHIVYTVPSESERAHFIASIKKVLKKDGTLAIVDNALVQDSTLPYHGPYIAKELVIQQMKYYGFRLTGEHQFIPQRYVLLFQTAAKPTAKDSSSRTLASLVNSPTPELIKLNSRKSLIHIGGSRPSETALLAARVLYEGLDQHQPEKIRLAHEQYTQLIPLENFGAEYTAMQWFCEYWLASEQARPRLLTNALVRDYFHFFADNDWAVLKEFLVRRNNLGSARISVGDLNHVAAWVQNLTHSPDPVSQFLWRQFAPQAQFVLTTTNNTERQKKLALTEQLNGIIRGDSIYDKTRFAGVKLSDETQQLLAQNPQSEDLLRCNRLLLEDAYPLLLLSSRNYRNYKDLDTKEGNDRRLFLNDFLWFNNPMREEWEKTRQIIDALKLQPGDAVADVGSGPGYYTFLFSDLVGKAGHVYAIDTNDRHVAYVADFAKKNQIPNVTGICSKLNDICLDEKVDLAFLCSLYHVIYATSMEKVKDEFIGSIKKALKKGGRLVIVDNDVVEPPVVRYHGSCIDPQLVMAQLKHYGFRLVKTYQFYPQRYVLVFQME